MHRLPEEWRLDAGRGGLTHILIHSQVNTAPKKGYKSGLLEKQSTKRLNFSRYLTPPLLLNSNANCKRFTLQRANELAADRPYRPAHGIRLNIDTFRFEVCGVPVQ